VFCAGPAMEHLWSSLPAARRGGWAPSADELAPRLTAAVTAGDVVMVKGSHASNAELLVEALTALENADAEA
jgi:UDP-N-acetylmuramoyl-tripeptide--D-alanyl-D-alanine ligase